MEKAQIATKLVEEVSQSYRKYMYYADSMIKMQG